MCTYAFWALLYGSLGPKYTTPKAQLPPLPLAQVFGHICTPCLAHDNGDSMTIYRALKIGSTDGSLEVYTLLAAL